MWVNLARVTPEAFELIQGDPELLEALFMDENADVLAKLGVAEDDISGLDYEAATEMIEAMGIDENAIEIDEEEGEGDDDDDDDDDGDDDEEEGDDDDDDEGDAEAEDDGTMEASDEEEEPDPVLLDLCIEGTINFDAGFGSAFFLSPAAAKQAAASSAALGLDDEAKAIVMAAAERGHFVIGVIS